MDYGILTISLDFELFWGVFDKRTLDGYRPNLEGTRPAIQAMLELFAAHGIHATWATVGCLFSANADQLQTYLPEQPPGYLDQRLSAHQYVRNNPIVPACQAYFFAPDVIRSIAAYPHQEIASHTMTHYYCLEAAQTAAEFRADLQAAQKVAVANGFQLQSLVFPRNQHNPDYLAILREAGFTTYRGTQASWLYRARAQESRIQRALRLIDSYFNLSGQHIYALEDCGCAAPINLPASHFLRPYAPRLAGLEWLRLRRIKQALQQAAIQKKIVHLWWHPHNFGVHLEHNLRFLQALLSYFTMLQQRYGMQSRTMAELYAMRQINAIDA